MVPLALPRRAIEADAAEARNGYRRRRNRLFRQDDVARALDQERKVYLQRLDAVSRLRRVADEQGDEDLRKKADDLEKQADEVFQLRTARLQAAGMDDRASLERGRDAGGASADATKRRTTRGGDR